MHNCYIKFVCWIQAECVAESQKYEIIKHEVHFIILLIYELQLLPLVPDYYLFIIKVPIWEQIWQNAEVFPYLSIESYSIFYAEFKYAIGFERSLLVQKLWPVKVPPTPMLSAWPKIFLIIFYTFLFLINLNTFKLRK